VNGAYAIAVVCDAEPHTLVCARKGSPLIIGIADNAYIVASDASAIISHTTQVFTLDDYQVAKLCAGPVDTKNGTNAPWSVDFRTTTIDNVPVTQHVRELDFDLEQIELGGHEHFMFKEICEQPEAIRTCLRGRIDQREGRVVLGGLRDHVRDLVHAKRFILTGQGTAYHAGLIGEYLLEDLAKIPARCEYASEFRYRNPIIEPGSVCIAISQSGETADTLAALREAKERGALALGAVNVVGSTISRETDAGVYLHVGPEIGVASTKAFVGQVLVLTLIALFTGRRKYLSDTVVREYLGELERLPQMIARVLEQSEHIKTCVERHVHRDNWLFLGRGYNYPVALEGALKLKEISYIHAEGMPAAEMKHGPIALIDEGMPVVFIATRGSQYDKVMSNIEEVRARGGCILAVATEGDDEIGKYADAVFTVPPVSEPLQPLLTVIPLQLVAYHAAVLRGHDVDKPRNLAKSVTVE
jgi:glucosamine--fructose-6-phosphate aminotransferase (isomerizing)